MKIAIARLIAALPDADGVEIGWRAIDDQGLCDDDFPSLAEIVADTLTEARGGAAAEPSPDYARQFSRSHPEWRARYERWKAAMAAEWERREPQPPPPTAA